MDFFIFLIENYAAFKNIGAEEVMKKLDEKNLTMKTNYDGYRFSLNAKAQN